jgi:N-hydroxyarylamine O-acetyltransferase
MDGDLRDAYLARLGLEAEPPSADALRRLHQAHAERVPYETVWIATEDGWDVDPARAVERIARHGRGGYCFHLNGAFSELLAELGYRVTRHVGGVHGPDGPSAAAMANHLVLTVEGLPTDANRAGAWYADVGLGDALHEPLPLVEGAYHQAPWQLALDRDAAAPVGDWHLTHDPAGGFPGMAWRSAATGMDAFVAQHRTLSGDPESGFVKVTTVQRRDATGVDVLRGLVMRRIGDRPSQSVVTTKGDLRDAFASLSFYPDDMDADRLEALWRKLRRQHEEWEAAGRP